MVQQEELRFETVQPARDHKLQRTVYDTRHCYRILLVCGFRGILHPSLDDKIRSPAGRARKVHQTVCI